MATLTEQQRRDEEDGIRQCMTTINVIYVVFALILFGGAFIHKYL